MRNLIKMCLVTVLFIFAQQSCCFAQEDYFGALNLMRQYNARGLIVLISTNEQYSKQFQKDVLNPLLPTLRKWYVIYVVDVYNEPDVSDLYRRAGMWDGLVPTYYLLSPGGKRILKGGSGAVSISSWVTWHNKTYR